MHYQKIIATIEHIQLTSLKRRTCTCILLFAYLQQSQVMITAAHNAMTNTTTTPAVTPPSGPSGSEFAEVSPAPSPEAADISPTPLSIRDCNWIHKSLILTVYQTGNTHNTHNRRSE